MYHYNDTYKSGKRQLFFVCLRMASGNSGFALDKSAAEEERTPPMTRHTQTLERRIERIKRALADLGHMRPGSLSTQTRKWGGAYGQLSYTHRGKGHTEYVAAHQRKLVRQHIDNYRRFRQLTQEWIDLEIELCKLILKENEQKS
jgi:hypothetical protein